MAHFKVFKEALKTTFPSLSVFSDIPWDDISNEYIAAHDEAPSDIDDFIFNFPQFLQDKASTGDCPEFLFEIAFFELIQNQVLSTELALPEKEGLHLNPTLSFLNLEFDVSLMMDEAAKGNVQIIERPHVMCIYKHPVRGLHHVDVTTTMLKVLQDLEKGIHSKNDLKDSSPELVQKMIQLGLVIEITQ